MKRIYYTIRPLFLSFLISISFILIATGQTPVAVLENATNETVLSSFEDGGLLVPGELNTGIIPAEGPGVRMMWYPGKAAFRAGQAIADEWDDSNVGEHSVAFGYKTTASKFFSTAFGAQTISTGNYSMAWGLLTQATNQFSTAFGYQTQATNMNSTAWGKSTIASEEFATAWGEGTMASGNYATAFGFHTAASGENSTTFGRNSNAIGDYSTAFGEYSKALGNYSTAWGQRTVASGHNTTAIGDSTIAATFHSASIGTYNLSNITSDGTLFVIGNGSGTGLNPRSDAFRVDEDGNVTASGDVTANGNASVLGSVVVAGNVTAASYITNSDRRLKDNIQSLEDHTLDKLAKIHPVRYTFKDQQTKPAGMQIGMIAQEVQAQFPELVTVGSDGFLSLSYSNFTAVLLKGMQEQQVQIQDLQKQMEEKNRQIQNLQAKVNLMDQFSERLARLEQKDQILSTTDAE